MKERIIELLRETGREGIEDLIAYMDEYGFFRAPCSTSHHLAKEGGACGTQLQRAVCCAGFVIPVVQRTRES